MFRMSNSRKVLWLLDFGIAAQIHETRTLTMSASKISGTPLYMAPEQAAGELQDARTDQYALAVITYEFLCGHPPFQGQQNALFYQLSTSGLRILKNVSRVSTRTFKRLCRKKRTPIRNMCRIRKST